MYKIYRFSLIALIWNTLGYAIATLALFVLVAYFLEIKIALVISAIIALLIILSMFKDLKTKVIISDDNLELHYHNKIYNYDLKKINYKAKMVNNDQNTLYITDNQGKIQDFDLSMLGRLKFESLLDDLDELTNKDKVIKIATTKR